MAATIQTIHTPKRARALDTSGNNNHGQIYSGRALEFDAVSDTLTVPSAVLNGQDYRNGTLAVWIYLASTPNNNDRIFSHATSNAIFYFTFKNDGKLRHKLGDSGDYTDSNTALDLSTWYRAVFTWDSDGAAKIYINGVEDDAATGVGTSTLNTMGTNNTSIGGHTTTTYLFDGKMSNLQLWNTTWSASDVTYDYLNPEQLALNRGGTSLTESNLKLWYPMQDGHRGQQSYILDGANVAPASKNHATTVFYGDEMITDANNRQMTSGFDWEEINLTDGEVTLSSGKLEVVTTTDDEEEGAVLAVANLTAPVAGRTYRFSAGLDSTSGDTTPTIIVSFGGGTASNTISTTEATHNFDIVAINTTGDLRVYTDSTTAVTFTIEDATVKEVGTATGWTDADQQLDIPQTALQSYNQLAWFDGVDSHIACGNDSSLQIAGDITYSCWFQTDSSATPLTLMEKFGSHTGMVVFLSSGKTRIWIGTGAATVDYQNFGSDLRDGKWHHLVVTNDEDVGTFVYVDGVSQTTGSMNTTASDMAANTARELYIGSYATTSWEFVGNINEVSVWDSALTLAQVVELYNDGKALDALTHSSIANLTAYWRNNGLATWTDLKGSNNGTPTNMTETLLLPAGVDGSRDNQGFIMNRQRATNSLNLADEGNAYVDVGTYSGFTFGDGSNDSAFSVSAWINAADFASLPIIAKGASSNREWSFAFTSGRALSLWLFDDSAAKYESMKSDSSLAANQNTWVHFAATYDGTGGTGANGGITLYRNGVALGMTEVKTDTYVAMEALAANVRVGSYEFSPTYADGQIDDVAIYSKELSVAEVLRNYNAGKRSHK